MVPIGVSPLYSKSSSSRSSYLPDYILAAQHSRPQILTYSWGKESNIFKSPTPERLGALAISPDGIYAVGGGASGRLYVWTTYDGELVTAFEGHYKSITCIAWGSCGKYFVTGGEVKEDTHTHTEVDMFVYI